jgi:hypothetical protein
MRRLMPLALLLLAAPALGGCLAGAVVGTAGAVVGTTAKVAVKTTGAVVDAAVPGDDEDEDDDR